MKTVRSLFSVVISICFLLGFVTQVWSAEPVQIQKQKTLPTTQTMERVVPIGMCSVSGTVKLDPNDKTNGYMHYKGPVTFKALKDLKGTNIYFSGPYSCTCLTCPKHSSYATGLSPEGTFQANQSKTYNIDCPSWQQPTSGPVGKGKIEYFIETSPPGGVFKWSDCTGNFNFTQ